MTGNLHTHKIWNQKEDPLAPQSNRGPFCLQAIEAARAPWRSALAGSREDGGQHGQILPELGPKTLPTAPSLSLSTHLEIPGSSVCGKLVFRSDFFPGAAKWSSTMLTFRAFSLVLPHSLQSVIPTRLLTSFFVAWVFHAYRFPGHWPPQAGLLVTLRPCPDARPGD